MSKYQIRYFLLLIFTLFPFFCFAEEIGAPPFNYWKEFVNMIITLIFVLALAFVSILFLKKMMRSKMHALNRSTAIKIIERRALHQKASLYLVDILGKTVVIGESNAGGIQLITEFPEGVDIEEKLYGPAAPEKAPTKTTTFNDFLTKLINTKGKK